LGVVGNSGSIADIEPSQKGVPPDSPRLLLSPISQQKQEMLKFDESSGVEFEQFSKEHNFLDRY